jgi:glycosyltransferase involved in cell wall biosynthesis/GT2 family glycosyltransferase
VRVLRISHSSVVDSWRGRERALRRRGVHIALLTARRFDEGGSTVTLAPRPGEPVTGVGTWGKHPALFVYDPRPIWRALAQPWDVIDVHEEPFALATAEVLLLRALRRSRTPVILYTAQNIRKHYPIPFRWFERRALRAASGISACNDEAAAIAIEKGFPGVARVIPLGIDPDEFSPLDWVAQTGPATADERIIVGFAGRLVPEKGAAVLIDAVARDARLVARIAGDGSQSGDLHARADALGVGKRIEFVGAVPSENIAEFYRSIDVLAIPSLPTPSWTEQFGRVAVEAMACGAPVVASDTGALPDVVGGAGIVVPPGDATALAGALVEAGGARREELREAGFARVGKCTWDAVAGDYLNLYASALHPAMPTERAVEIIVVAYGAPQMLRHALEPVAGLTVTLVDNSSLPEIAVLCAELGVRYLDAGWNRGFAAGVNLGLAHRLDPDANVLLLNPDARIEPDQIAVLQHGLHADPRLGSAAPAQVDGDGHPARVAWPFPSPLNAWLEAVGLARLQRGPRFAIGAVLLLRAEALAQVGRFDEDFFLYAEETDWAYRANLLGWRHAVIGNATAIHIGAGTSTDDRVRTLRFQASQERFYRKHYGALGWQAARLGMWAGAFGRSLILRGQRGAAARERAALLRLGPMRVAAQWGATP